MTQDIGTTPEEGSLRWALKQPFPLIAMALIVVVLLLAALE